MWNIKLIMKAVWVLLC